ncbi:hypothetical protein [Alkalilimnicola ehrlichii]|uniref:hypothetical protein n=1 Tax=Alkalilimnicola ehrlichii TaxID=351052 RepID=UPI003BA2182D
MSTWITRAAALLFVAAMLALAGCNSSSTGGALGQHPVNAEGSGDAVIVDPTEGETDLSGTFSVKYQANDVGDFHVLVSRSGAEYQHSFSVDQFGIEFIEPDESGGL